VRVTARRVGVVVLVAALSVSAFAGLPSSGVVPVAHAAPTTLSRSDVTIYGASWCSACRSLEKSLTERGVPFDVVDVEKNRDSWERAKAAAGAGNAIPLTGVAKGSETVWFVGADADGVERAYKSR